MIDLHCHILPGLDDGAKSLEESLDMAKIAAGEGVTTVVATPHLFRWNLAIEDIPSVEERRHELCEALAKNGIPIDIKAGAEVHISHNLVEELRTNRRYLVINNSRYMFLEFPSSHIFPGVKKLIFDLMSEGITPIIAHPERNYGFVENPGLLYDLIEMGVLAQANGGSLTGLYGRGAAGAVVRFLTWNLIHFLASDGHHPKSIPPRLSEAVKRAEASVGKDEARHLVVDNPKAVLEDRQVPYLPSPKDPRKSKRSFHIQIPSFLTRSK